MGQMKLKVNVQKVKELSSDFGVHTYIKLLDF